MAYTYQSERLFPNVEIYHDLIPYLGGIGMRDFFQSPAKCAAAWRQANEALADFAKGRFPLRRPSPAPLSYGHLACLGAPISFPEDGEPNVSAFVGSVQEGIELLRAKRGMDFSADPLFAHYLDTWHFLREQFPQERMPFSGFGAQGPITSAVLMRGQDFYCDLYDEPEQCAEFLALLVDSIADFVKLERRINGVPEVSATGSIADDFASLVAPAMWPEFVLPALERHYRLLSDGKKRGLHMEGLSPAHVPLLNELHLTRFQPSVSDLLTPQILRERLAPETSFDWLLYAYHVTEMTDDQIQAWVDETARAGVRIIRTQIGAYAFMTGKQDRVLAFWDAFEKYRTPGE